VRVLVILESVFLIRTKEGGRSRNSGFFTNGHTEILWWSRNSGPDLFVDPTELLCTFQKYWTLYFVS
jgi:hypothetical protein